jgi:hypothetical protein
MKKLNDSNQLSLFGNTPADLRVKRNKRARRSDASSYSPQLDLFLKEDGFKNPDGDPDRGSSFYIVY